MTSGKGYTVNVPALRTYSKNLGFYEEEADAFGRLVDQADVTNESWGLIGLAVKGQYTDKLQELRDLLDTMKQGVQTFSDKINTAATIYQGAEDDATMNFGKHEAHIDGPR